MKTQALEQANTMLQNLAINDGLTGLYNRRHFQDCLSAEIDLCKRYEDFFTLLFLDLDYFKEYGKWSPQIGEPLIGKQLLYNGLVNRFKIIEKLKDPDCWTCSYKKPLS